MYSKFAIRPYCKKDDWGTNNLLPAFQSVGQVNSYAIMQYFFLNFNFKICLKNRCWSNRNREYCWKECALCAPWRKHGQPHVAWGFEIFRSCLQMNFFEIKSEGQHLSSVSLTSWFMDELGQTSESDLNSGSASLQPGERPGFRIMQSWVRNLTESSQWLLGAFEWFLLIWK